MDRVGQLAERFIRAAMQSHPDNDVIYVGVFLTPMGRQKLLKAFPPEHATVWAHHMTVWHFKGGTPLPDLPWGRTVTLKVVRHFKGARAQAVAVDPPTKLRPEGRVPHITISTTSGTPPVVSNDLVGGSQEWEPVRGLPGIQAQIGWVDGAGRVHFNPPPKG